MTLEFRLRNSRLRVSRGLGFATSVTVVSNQRGGIVLFQL